MKFGDPMSDRRQNSYFMIILYVLFLVYRFVRLLLVNGNDDFWTQVDPLNTGLFWYYIIVSILILLYSLNHMMEWINIHENILIGLLVLYLPFSIPIFVLILCGSVIDFDKTPGFGLFHARYLVLIISLLFLYMVVSIPFIHKAFSIQKTQDVAEVQFDSMNFNLHGGDGYVNGSVDLYFEDNVLYIINADLRVSNWDLENTEPIIIYVNGLELCEGHIVSDKFIFSEIVKIESSEIMFTDDIEFSYSYDNVLYVLAYGNLERYERTKEYQIFELS